MNPAKRLRERLWSILLSSRSLRRRLAYHLLYRYPADLDARVPLGENLSSPLFDAELGASFEEIFLYREYAPMFDAIPPPRRWIDLGCYAGFFSLWLEWQRRRLGDTSPSEVLLVDANSSLSGWIERVIAANGLGNAWTYRRGAIAPGRGECEYVERSYMGSSLGALDKSPGVRVQAPVLDQDELLRTFAPPYDLLKVDIEGAEFEMLRHYPRLVEQSRCVCLEWHSWHSGGGGLPQIRELAEGLGLMFSREIQPARVLPSGDQTGVILFTNPRFSATDAIA
jgi:FkbM family methyltransferase